MKPKFKIGDVIKFKEDKPTILKKVRFLITKIYQKSYYNHNIDSPDILEINDIDYIDMDFELDIKAMKQKLFKEELQKILK